MDSASDISLCANASHSSITDSAWRLEGEYRVGGLVSAAFLIIFIIIGLPWNLMVVVTIVKQSLYREPTNILLLNLTLSDILLLLIAIFNVITGLTGEFLYGSSDHVRCEFCRGYRFFSHVCFASSLSSIVLLSFDRFMYIYKPLRYDKLITATRTTVAVIFLWLLLVVLVLAHVFTQRVTFSPLRLVCTWESSERVFITIINTVFLSLLFVVLIVCNSYVVYITQRNIRAIYRVRRSLTTDTERKFHRDKLNNRIRKSRHQKQLHMIRVFGSLFSSNIITWVPLAIVKVVNLFTFNVPVGLVVIGNMLFMSQVAIHPILETVLISDIREPMKKMVFYCCLKTNKTEGPERSCVCSVNIPSLDSLCDCKCSFFDICSAAVLPQEESEESVQPQ